jgi:hypothetical protein
MPKEQLRSIPATIFDMLRDIFTFLLKGKYFDEAVKICKKSAMISEAFDIESAKYKAFCSETILMVLTKDVIKAQQVHLSHFECKAYLSSKECELADMLVMAVLNQDADNYDEVRRHSQLQYLDQQLSAMIRQTNFFTLIDGSETYDNQVSLKMPAVTATIDSSAVSHIETAALNEEDDVDLC